MKILAIILFILVLITCINIFQPKARFNLAISWLYPFAFHPFLSVSKKWSGYYKNLEHEDVHCQQQAAITFPVWLILYFYYSIRGMFKYGLEKTDRIYVGRMGKGLKRKLAKWYVYNPYETEAFIREDKKLFNKIYPEIKEVTAFSHLLEIYKDATL